jgi:hypothetical protein
MGYTPARKARKGGIFIRYTFLRYIYCEINASIRCMLMKRTFMRCIFYKIYVSIRYTPIRCTSVRYTFMVGIFCRIYFSRVILLRLSFILKILRVWRRRGQLLYVEIKWRQGGFIVTFIFNLTLL